MGFVPIVLHDDTFDRLKRLKKKRRLKSYNAAVEVLLKK
jgi:hypothetical protein